VRRLVVFAFVGLLVGSSRFWASSDQPLERIAFGSCYKPEKQTLLWSEVKKLHPQLWIWLGDNFYNDWVGGKYIAFNSDPDAFSSGYEQLRKSQGMEALGELMPERVMATWDDHDFGKNDSGKEYPRKEEARTVSIPPKNGGRRGNASESSFWIFGITAIRYPKRVRSVSMATCWASPSGYGLRGNYRVRVQTWC
jgi:hypothetical protein